MREHAIASPLPAFVPAVVRPDLSICIINWNCRDNLRVLLESIDREKEDLLIEVIVVDNASTDDSTQKVASEFPDVVLVRNSTHQGIAKTNNTAAAHARGALLLFMNNDTAVLPQSLVSLVRFCEHHPDVVAVSSRLRFPDGRNQGTVRGTLSFAATLHRLVLLRWTKIFRAAERNYQQDCFNLDESAYVENVVGAALLVRRPAFDRIGCWDEGFEFRLDDIDLSTRLRRLGQIYYLADAQVIHWGGLATELDQVYAYRNSEHSYLHYLRKHHGARQAFLYKILVTMDMPFRIVILALTWTAKRIFAPRARADRNLRKLAAATEFFLRGLPDYWRS